MRTFQKNLRVYGDAIIAANGTATAFISQRNGPSWEIKQIAIVCSSTLLTSASTYIGINSSGIFISSTTFNGNKRTDSQPNVTLKLGDSLCCVWTGGTPGALCRMTVTYDEVDY